LARGALQRFREKKPEKSRPIEPSELDQSALALALESHRWPAGLESGRV